MKNSMIVLLILICRPAWAQEDVITRFFSQYEGKDDFTTVYITSKMFSLIAQIPEDEDEDEVMSVIRKLNGMRILSSEKSPLANELYDEAYKLLPRNGFEDLMIVKNGNEETKFLVHQKGEIISEFVMLSGGNNNFTLISMTGNLLLKDISKLSKTMDINGFDKLDKLDNKQ
jgi:hypothetical protein